MDKIKENNQDIEQMFRGGGAYYRDKIIDMVGQIENLDYLEFIYNMIVSFQKKWGI